MKRYQTLSSIWWKIAFTEVCGWELACFLSYRNIHTVYMCSQRKLYVPLYCHDLNISSPVTTYVLWYNVMYQHPTCRLLVFFFFFKLIMNTAVTENRRKVSSKLLQEVNVLVQTTRPSGLPLHTNLSAMVQSVHFRFRVLLSTNNWCWGRARLVKYYIGSRSPYTGVCKGAVHGRATTGSLNK